VKARDELGKQDVRLLPKRRSLIVLTELDIAEEGEASGNDSIMKGVGECKREVEEEGAGDESDATITPALYEGRRRSALILEESGVEGLTISGAAS
jgi:hypothetical protein